MKYFELGSPARLPFSHLEQRINLKSFDLNDLFPIKLPFIRLKTLEKN